MSEPELIFVTDVTDYIPGEKICHVEKFQLSILNLNNLWNFIEVLAVFVPNLCGEKSVRRKSMWRKNDKYKVRFLDGSESFRVAWKVSWYP